MAVKSESTVGAFVTHTAEEVANLSDDQILILWAGAHDWIKEGRETLADGRAQLAATETEIRRRGIKKKPLGDII